MNWKVIRATKAIRITSTGQPRCRASPVLTPPSQAPSATLVARGPSLRRGETGPARVAGDARQGRGPAGGGASTAGAASPRSAAPADGTRRESVAVMIV